MVHVDRRNWKKLSTCPACFTNLFGVSFKIIPDKSGGFLPHDYSEPSKSKNIEIEYSSTTLHNGTDIVGRAKQTLKNLNIGDLEIRFWFIRSVNQAQKVLGFSIHTGLKLTQFEMGDVGKPGTKLTITIKVNKKYLSDSTKWKNSLTSKQVPFFVGCNFKRDVTNHIVLARINRIPWFSTHRPRKELVKPVSRKLE